MLVGRSNLLQSTLLRPTGPHVGGSGAALDGIANLTGAWSMGRALLTAYGGSFYTDTGSNGTADVWLDQSGNSRNFTIISDNPPAITTAGPNSRACARFGGVSDAMQAAAISNFITASDGYIIASFIARTIATTSASLYLQDGLWADAGGYIGAPLGASDATRLIRAYNWDGTEDTPVLTDAHVSGTAYVFEWWHTGGNLFGRLNGGTERSIASGNTQVITGVLRIGGASGGMGFTDYDLFELAAFNVVPSGTDRDAITANFKTWIGA